MDSDVPELFANVHDLRSWLISREIPIERWGGESPSYPGLVTCYRMSPVEMAIRDLPDTAFSTAESDPSQDATVKIHYWDWRTDTL